MNDPQPSYVYGDPALAVPVTEAPRRVVSLVPSVTESLFDLNLGARLVGITDYCVRPSDHVSAIRHVGGTKNPDIQRIVDLRPDLVIANQEENRRQDVETLREAGIPVWVTFPKSVADVFNLLWDIMNLFEETSMVPRVRLIEYTYDWVQGISRGRDDQPCRVFVPIWKNPWMTFNADTYAHDLLWVCGGLNVFAERERRYPLQADVGAAQAYPPDDPRAAGRDTRYPRVTLEEVAAAQPDVILLPSEPYPFTEADIVDFAALDVPAARENRIRLVDGSLLFWHGTRVAYALNEIPSMLCSPEDA
jgi:ABC-type Fe3+-hydroxamate transport system substrate-binding protein